MEDTISAIATALGVGAVGIIRVSGPESLRLVNRIFRAKEPLSSSRPRYLQYGHIHDGKGVDVDEVLAVYMPGPHSYTGEDVVEIQCHGGREALKEILRLTFSEGARPAEPGEFTKRAFLNGRLDLTEAEAVMDIINAKSRRALVAAGRGHKGALSRSIREIRGRLRDLVVHLEAIIDYPEDDIEDVTYDETEGVLQQCYDAVMQLRKKGETGQILREGLRIAIVGRPNVGKSSLLNRLLQTDRAIVSNIPGTTRDIIEEQMTLDGIPLVLTDTAGLRDTEDYVEQIGVKRSRAILDPHLVLLNKSDLAPALSREEVEALSGGDVLSLSVKDGAGMDQVGIHLRHFVMGEGSDAEMGLMTQNARQGMLLEQAAHHLAETLRDARAHLPYDCLTIDLTQVLHELGEITGDDVPEEIINEIFAQFCVGK